MSNASAREALANRRNNGQAEPGTEVEERPRLISMLENPKWAKQFENASPTGAEGIQVIRDVTTAALQTPAILECTPNSVIGAAMTCAQLGLRVGVLGHAWILPFKQKAQLVIGYKGYRQLAYRSGMVTDMIARPVHEHDTFQVRYGTADELIHEPPPRGTTGGRGQITDYYAVVKFTTGGHAFWVMSKAEVEDHRDRFAMQRDRTSGKVKGPWADHFDAMAAKSCFLQLAKWAPMSAEVELAVNADNRVRIDLDPDGITKGYVPGMAGDDPDVPLEAEIVPPDPADGSES